MGEVKKKRPKKKINERQDIRKSIRLVLEAAPNGMIIVDPDGRIILVNGQTEKIFGYSREELIGQKIEILVPQRFCLKHPEYRQSFFKDPKIRSLGAGRDLFGLRKDGVEVPIEIGLNPIETSGGICALASIIDITERKWAEEVRNQLIEELENANRNLKDFAQAVSRDLKASLREINSLPKKKLQLIRQRIQRIQTLINGILQP